MNYNEVILSGIINNVIDNQLYITIGLTCNKYSKDEKSNVVYASLRIYRDLYEKYKGLFCCLKKYMLRDILILIQTKIKKSIIM